jgi:sugar/nucleoside kinase (ribokinase family)
MIRAWRKKRYDFISIGDAVVDVFLSIQEASVSCQLKREECLLCLKYGEKIPLKSITRIPGAGNASNVAIGASRLGWHSAIVSVLGNDEFAHEMRKHWEKEEVSCALVRVDRKHESSYNTILHYKDERTILSYHQPREYHMLDIDHAKWIYYTSLGKGHEAFEKHVLAHLHKNKEQHLSFNPGTFQLRRGLSSIKPVIARSNVFCVNKEEAQFLLKTKETDMKKLTHAFFQIGAKIVIITDGTEGSYAYDGQDLWHCPIFPGECVERTGAGDSFALGFVFGLEETKSIAEAMRHGTANSWSVIQYVGPQKGLLTEEEMERVLKKFKKVQPRIVG